MMEQEMVSYGYCVVIPEEEIDRVLAMEVTGDEIDPELDIECCIRMGKYDVMGDGKIYDKVTGKYVGKLEKPINRY